MQNPADRLAKSLLRLPRGDAREYVRLIGDNARREMFDDTGHLVMLERPSRFNRLLADFIADERAPEAGVEAEVAVKPI